MTIVNLFAEQVTQPQSTDFCVVGSTHRRCSWGGIREWVAVVILSCILENEESRYEHVNHAHVDENTRKN